jgi:hypothetical protein
VTFSISFNLASFSGAKQLYLSAANANGSSTNFQQPFGLWNVFHGTSNASPSSWHSYTIAQRIANPSYFCSWAIVDTT